MAVKAAVKLQPILDADVEEVADYLQSTLSSHVTSAQWAAAMRAPWQHDAPNHGVFLRANGTVVGAYLALYSVRDVRGEPIPVCNLAAWCVDPDYRFSSVRMLKALLAQEGYSFVDLSPSGNVIALNERLGFSHLDTSTAVVVNLPWPTMPGRYSISSDPGRFEAVLSGPELQIYRDHADAPAARHLLLESPGGYSHVIYRRDRRKNLPIFATILYASDSAVLRSMRSSLCRHLLVRHGLPFLLIETRVAGERMRPSVMLSTHRRKMFKSTTLQAEDIDNLYSELVAVAW